MYEKNGITYPRVTTIISDSTNSAPGLMQWSSDQACKWIRENCDKFLEPFDDFMVSEEELEQARFAYKDTSKIAKDVGSDVHNAIEKHLKGESYTLVSTQAEKAFGAFLEWEMKVWLKPYALEQTVWGDRWAGTMDFYGLYRGKLYVIDWKTSKKFYPEMRYQTGAYRSVTEDPVEGCGVLMLNKTDGMPRFHDTSKTYEKDLKVFNAMVELYFLRHPRIAKRFEKGE